MWIKLNFLKIWHSLLVIIVFFILWQVGVMLLHIPSYLFPSPFAIFLAFKAHYAILFWNSFPTLFEAFIGLILGSSIGFFIGILLIRYQRLNDWFWPFIIIMQAIPSFAIAPLLMIWFGFGLTSKIALCTIVIFFPVTSAFYDGLHKIPKAYYDMNSIMKGTPWRFLWNIQIPYALPFFSSGLKVTASYAMAGAALGEWIGSNKGLGFMMLRSNANFQIPLMFASLFLVVILTLMFYFLVRVVTDRFIWWHS